MVELYHFLPADRHLWLLLSSEVAEGMQSLDLPFRGELPLSLEQIKLHQIVTVMHDELLHSLHASFKFI